MGLLDSIKSKADVNGDGKIDKKDFQALNTDENKAKLQDLKGKIDKDGDGKVSIKDLKGANIKDLAKDAKNTFSK